MPLAFCSATDSSISAFPLLEPEVNVRSVANCMFGFSIAHAERRIGEQSLHGSLSQLNVKSALKWPQKAHGGKCEWAAWKLGAHDVWSGESSLRCLLDLTRRDFTKYHFSVSFQGASARPSRISRKM